jgi:hypothetical protein
MLGPPRLTSLRAGFSANPRVDEPDFLAADCAGYFFPLSWFFTLGWMAPARSLARRVCASSFGASVITEIAMKSELSKRHTSIMLVF